MALSKRRILSVFLLAVGLAIAGFLVANPTLTIRIPQQRIQEEVDRRMPLSGRKLAISYQVSDARAELQGERIGLSAVVKASALRREIDVSFAGDGILAYRDGGFYLRDFNVAKVDLLRTVESPRDRGTIAKALEKLGVENGDAFLQGRKDLILERAKEAAADLVRSTLDRRPVYVMPKDGIKANLARLALRDVKVEGTDIVATLDVVSAIARLLLWALVAVVAVLAAAGIFLGAARSGGAGALAGFSLLD